MAVAHCTNGKPLPAVAYIRMSDGRQAESPEQQRAEVAKLAERMGYRLIREFFDEAISGDQTEKRSGFLEMREAAQRGEFRAVLCWDQDRFGRFDSIDGGYWIKPFRDAGVQLVTVAQGPISWSDFAGRLVYLVAQEGKHAYLRDLSRNVVRGTRAAAEAETLVIPCYGYIVQDGRLVPDPATAPVVRRVFRLYLKPGASLRSICGTLNDEGIPAPNGGQWRTTILRTILKRRKYTGAYTWGETQVGTYHSAGTDGVVLRAKTDPVRHVAPLIVRPDRHEALVSVEDFEAVQAKLADNQRRTAPFQGGGDYLLSGLMRCAHCGASLIGQSRRNGTRLYMCGGYHFHGRSECRQHLVAETPLVDAIVRKLQEEFLAPERLEVLKAEILRQAQAEQQQADPDEAERLRKRVAALDKQIDTAADRILAAPESIAPTLYARVERLQDQRRQLQGQLQATEKPVDATEDGEAEKVQEAIAALWTLREAIAGATQEELRFLLQEAIDRIEVHFRQSGKGDGKPEFQRAVVCPKIDPRLFQLVQLGQQIR